MKHYIFSMKKIKLKKGCSSMVWPGEGVTNGYLFEFDWTKEDPLERRKPINSLDEVRTGKQLLIVKGLRDSIRTSKVEKIIKRTKRTLTFETQTSVYKITQKIDKTETLERP